MGKLEGILNFWVTGYAGLLLYWLPLAFCAYGYLLRTHRNYQNDKAERESPESWHYCPTDTLGSLIGRGLVTVIPVANLMAALFDLGPEVFAQWIKRFELIFNAPLVPDNEAAKAKREAARKARHPS